MRLVHGALVILIAGLPTVLPAAEKPSNRELSSQIDALERRVERLERREKAETRQEQAEAKKRAESRDKKDKDKK
jgi:hypothetical protein